MDVNKILKELKLDVEVGSTLERKVPHGCCGSSITQHQCKVKSIGIYKDSFGRKILLFETDKGDFLNREQFVVVKR